MGDEFRQPVEPGSQPRGVTEVLAHYGSSVAAVCVLLHLQLPLESETADAEQNAATDLFLRLSFTQFVQRLTLVLVSETLFSWGSGKLGSAAAGARWCNSKARESAGGDA
jgi:hypothetical protein